jgi:type IV pilus assembly protein PilB
MATPSQGATHSHRSHGGIPDQFSAEPQNLSGRLESLKASLRKTANHDVRIPGESGTPTLEQLIARVHNHPASENSHKVLDPLRQKGLVFIGSLPDDADRIAIGMKAFRDAEGKEMISASASAFMLQNDVEPLLRRLHLRRDQVMYLLLSEQEYTKTIGLVDSPQKRQAFLGQINTATEASKTFMDMFSFAVNLRASDIHFEPFREGKYRVRFRVDGALQDWGMTIDGGHADKLVGYVKGRANLKYDESRRGQDGRIHFTDEQKASNPESRNYSLRISIMPTNLGEKINMRLLNSDSSGDRYDLRSLGYPEPIYRAIKKQLASPQGLIICTGPTGSGKTTTLYSMLTSLNTPDVNIVTIEDPVEMNLDGINQGEVNEELGNTFEQALRRYLRQDPDIIFVGEIRDKETARVALSAANTGHLVLSTVHTNDSVASVTRLLDLGVLKSQVAECLRAVISQRLVRNLCTECSDEYDARDELNELFGEELLTHSVPFRRKGSEEACAGCSACNGHGFKGRTVVPELWIPGKSEQAIINAGNSTHNQLFDAAEKGGMKPLVITAIELALSGKTSLSELSENVFTPMEIHEQRARIAQTIKDFSRRHHH